MPEELRYKLVVYSESACDNIVDEVAFNNMSILDKVLLERGKVPCQLYYTVGRSLLLFEGILSKDSIEEMGYFIAAYDTMYLESKQNSVIEFMNKF